jgi:hypothetical protein
MAEYFATRASVPVKSVLGTSSQAPNVMGPLTIMPQQEAAHRVSHQIQPFVDEPQPTPSTSATGSVMSPFSDVTRKGSVTPRAKSASDYISTAQATTSRDEKQSKTSSPTPPALANPIHPVSPQQYKPSGGCGAVRADSTVPQSASNPEPPDFCQIPTLGTSIRRERDQNLMATPTVERAAIHTPALSAVSSSDPIPSLSTSSPVLTRTREEHLYHETGYFVAPHPPNELDRRTALHKSV